MLSERSREGTKGPGSLELVQPSVSNQKGAPVNRVYRHLRSCDLQILTTYILYNLKIERIVFDFVLVFVESAWLPIQKRSCPPETIPLMRNWDTLAATFGFVQ